MPTETEIDDNAADIDAPVDVADSPRQATPYERKLRAEAQRQRLAREADRAAHTAALTKAQQEAEARVAEAQSAASARIIRAEMKAAALKAGMVDLDGLKMLDLGAIKLNDQGEVEGADAILEAARKAKPYLFGAVSTSSTSPSPRNEPARDFDARTASPAELAAWERKMGLRR